MAADTLAGTFDAAVLGAGAAGMLVALAAQARGQRVLLVEPHASAASNFAISGGLFPAAGSRLQAAAGVHDRPEDWLRDLRAFAPEGAVNERIATAVAEALPRVVDFLLDEAGAPVRFLPDTVAPGHRALRFHSVQPASGAAFAAWFRSAVQARPGIVYTPRRALARRAGEGFELDWADGSPPARARALVLAGGGFGADAAMVARHIPAMAGALHNGSATNDGSTVALGVAWGAALWGMDGYQGQGHTNPGGATRLGMSIPPLGGVLINRDGQRFVREDVGPSALAAHVLAQPGGVALEVFDAAIEAQLGNASAYQAARAADQVLQADTVEDLAAKAGVPAPALRRTLADVEAWATLFADGTQAALHAGDTAGEDARSQAGAAAGEGRDRPEADPLGRERFPRALQPPYRASWVTGALSHTQGGLLTDADGRVLGPDDRPLPGLYANGGCAAGLVARGGEGYLPGNGLAQAFGLGWRVAQALA